MRFWDECNDFTVRDAFFAIDNTNDGFFILFLLVLKKDFLKWRN